VLTWVSALVPVLVLDALADSRFLVDTAVISSLPPAWDGVSSRQASAHPLEAKRYAELVARLQSLVSQRDDAAARVARLQRMRTLLEPFDDAAGVVQENLVTRNGEVETELQRMRMLLARVGGRVSQLREREGAATGRGGDEMEGLDVEAEERRKVGQLLEKF
jgi:hypothetical protein